jgi:Zn-dependent alcohol dehydrogenase
LYCNGHLDLDERVTIRYFIDHFNDAARDLTNGSVTGRPIWCSTESPM